MTDEEPRMTPLEPDERIVRTVEEGRWRLDLVERPYAEYQGDEPRLIRYVILTGRSEDCLIERVRWHGEESALIARLAASIAEDEEPHP